MLSVEVEETTPPLMKVQGEADYHNRSQIYDAVKSLIEGGHSTVHADLSELSYIDSSALATLIRCATEAREAGGVMELTGASSQVSRVLHKCGATLFFGSSCRGLPVCGGFGLADSTLWRVSEFSLPASPEAASVARQRLLGLLGSLPLSMTESIDVMIAFGEAVANAVRHGCACDEQLRISVRFVAGLGYLAIDVSDPGPGFRPEEVPVPSPRSILDGGMGIYIMREMMDKVEFFFDGGTTTRLTKHLRTGDTA